MTIPSAPMGIFFLVKYWQEKGCLMMLTKQIWIKAQRKKHFTCYLKSLSSPVHTHFGNSLHCSKALLPLQPLRYHWEKRSVTRDNSLMSRWHMLLGFGHLRCTCSVSLLLSWKNAMERSSERRVLIHFPPNSSCQATFPLLLGECDKLKTPFSFPLFHLKVHKILVSFYFIKYRFSSHTLLFNFCGILPAGCAWLS